MHVPGVIYFDLESLLLPVYGPQPDPEKSSTQTLEIHQPCGYALAVVELGKREVLKFELQRGENVMKELIASLESLAKKISSEQIALLKQKSFYPYSYFSSFEKFRETRLLPRKMWSNTLQGGEISVSKNQYNHAIKVFAEMKCASLGEYHDVYLATDVLLLASVFEAFREV